MTCGCLGSSQPNEASECSIMRSKGRECVLLHSNVKCDLARDGSGNPIVLSKKCDKCGEWRCKTHCRCGRTGTAKGRNAARPGKRPKARARPQAAAAAAPAPGPAPQARAKAAAAAAPPPLSVEVLEGSRSRLQHKNSLPPMLFIRCFALPKYYWYVRSKRTVMGQLFLS